MIFNTRTCKTFVPNDLRYTTDIETRNPDR